MGPDSFYPITKTIICGAAACGAGAILFALAMLAVTPRQAGATPAYAQQTGLPCGRCHVNPGGGGKLTSYGAKFQANGHK